MVKFEKTEFVITCQITQPMRCHSGMLDAKVRKIFIQGFYCHLKADPWTYYTIDCPLSEGNQVAHPKFERPNGKN